jgi:hypothetical protein
MLLMAIPAALAASSNERPAAARAVRFAGWKVTA